MARIRLAAHVEMCGLLAEFSNRFKALPQPGKERTRGEWPLSSIIPQGKADQRGPGNAAPWAAAKR